MCRLTFSLIIQHGFSSFTAENEGGAAAACRSKCWLTATWPMENQAGYLVKSKPDSTLGWEEKRSNND